MKTLSVICILTGISLVFASGPGKINQNLAIESEIDAIFLQESDQEIDTNNREAARIEAERRMLLQQMRNQDLKETSLKARLKRSRTRYDKASRDYEQTYSIAKQKVANNRKLVLQTTKMEQQIVELQQQIRKLQLRINAENQRNQQLGKRKQRSKKLLQRQRSVLKKMGEKLNKG